jgi:high-affinity K+ transport system ATPase subunit B
MITGDNPFTAAAIAREEGVDDFLAQAKPERYFAVNKSGASSKTGWGFLCRSAC